MTNSSVAPTRKAVLDALLLDLPDVAAGKMFGFDAYYVNGKLFACLYGEGVGVKVPAATAEQLLAEQHIVPFQPMGKAKMREWIQINRLDPADYRNDIDLFRGSIEFVRRLSTHTPLEE